MSDITVDLSAAGANTRLEYMYRDASNYKQYGSAVLAGRISPEQVAAIESSLSDGEFFIPGQVGLKDLQSEFREGAGWDDDDDHVWHTICSIEHTDDRPTADTPVEQMMQAWPKGPNDWDIVGHTDRLQASLPTVGRTPI